MEQVITYDGDGNPIVKDVTLPKKFRKKTKSVHKFIKYISVREIEKALISTGAKQRKIKKIMREVQPLSWGGILRFMGIGPYYMLVGKALSVTKKKAGEKYDEDIALSVLASRLASGVMIMPLDPVSDWNEFVKARKNL